MKVSRQQQARIHVTFASTQHLIQSTPPLELELIALKNLGFEVSIEQGQLQPSIPIHTIQTEALRVALWMHSAQGTQSVHINRILRAAQRLLRPIWVQRGKTDEVYSLADGNDDIDFLADVREDAGLDDRLYVLHRDALNELDAIGDIVELPYGYWMPAPLRVVALPKSGSWLLVGGIPTNCLPASVRAYLKHSNFARLLSRAPDALDFRCAQQSFTTWSDQPADKLLVWTERILHETILESFSSMEGCYLYVPSPGQTQEARWKKEYQHIKDGRYLARIRRGAQTHYRVVLLKQHDIMLWGEIVWGIRDPQRLCYDLDALSGCPVSIHEKRVSNGYILTINNALPKAEQRLLIALGRVNTQKSTHYHSNWTISTEHIMDVREALQQIGVKILTR